MKLSVVVDYLNLLDTLNIDQESQEATRKMAAILHVVLDHEWQQQEISQSLSGLFVEFKNSLANFDTVLSKLRQQIQHHIKIREPEYYQASSHLYNVEMLYETVDYILQRRLRIDGESDVKLRSRLRNLSDWRLPGMIIRPATESYVEDMVPLDPLYLVDEHADLLQPCMNKFTQEYQKRLRRYVINDRAPINVLGDLPNNQFGLIFAYNYFNYKPQEVIAKFLSELQSKLRPGGSLIMTYNNCDRAHGVGLAEASFMTYVPKTLVLQHAATAGLEYVSDHDGERDVSWIEFVKPGTITSLRGGQTLAKIIALSK